MITVLRQVPTYDVLKNSVFVYPTETCYGIGCDATNEKLVERIYAIKGRDHRKLLSWLVQDIAMAKRYAEFSPRAAALAEKFWPGPLTLVVRKKMSGGMETVALRISSHSVARQIVDIFKRPIVATSANISGASECYSVCEVMEQLANRSQQPDFILDGGELPKKPPTTVVELTGDAMRVLRQGEIVVTDK